MEIHEHLALQLSHERGSRCLADCSRPSATHSPRLRESMRHWPASASLRAVAKPTTSTEQRAHTCTLLGAGPIAALAVWSLARLASARRADSALACRPVG